MYGPYHRRLVEELRTMRDGGYLVGGGPDGDRIFVTAVTLPQDEYARLREEYETKFRKRIEFYERKVREAEQKLSGEQLKEIIEEPLKPGERDRRRGRMMKMKRTTRRIY
jgi:hypothetical protein